MEKIQMERTELFLFVVFENWNENGGESKH